MKYAFTQASRILLMALLASSTSASSYADSFEEQASSMAQCYRDYAKIYGDMSCRSIFEIEQAVFGACRNQEYAMNKAIKERAGVPDAMDSIEATRKRIGPELAYIIFNQQVALKRCN